MGTWKTRLKQGALSTLALHSASWFVSGGIARLPVVWGPGFGAEHQKHISEPISPQKRGREEMCLLAPTTGQEAGGREGVLISGSFGI